MGRFPRLSLVIGGARSGKSAFAERLVAGSGLPRLYLATAQAFDAEMAARIAHHRGQRQGWTTVEAPHDLAAALAAVPPGTAVLVDCATLWLSNRMLAGADIPSEINGLLDALAACSGPVAVVTNEVGLSIVPDNPLARRFRDEQGRLNQRLAAAADLAVALWAGLPLVLKGRLPGGLG